MSSKRRTGPAHRDRKRKLARRHGRQARRKARRRVRFMRMMASLMPNMMAIGRSVLAQDCIMPRLVFRDEVAPNVGAPANISRPWPDPTLTGHRKP